MISRLCLGIHPCFKSILWRQRFLLRAAAVFGAVIQSRSGLKETVLLQLMQKHCAAKIFRLRRKILFRVQVRPSSHGAEQLL